MAIRILCWKRHAEIGTSRVSPLAVDFQRFRAGSLRHLDTLAVYLDRSPQLIFIFIGNDFRNHEFKYRLELFFAKMSPCRVLLAMKAKGPYKYCKDWELAGKDARSAWMSESRVNQAYGFMRCKEQGWSSDRAACVSR